LCFLFLLPLISSVSALVLELAARSTGSATQPRPGWLLITGTALVHATGLALIHGVVRVHRYRWREAFGLFGPGWVSGWLWAAVLTLPAMGVALALHEGSGWLLESVGIEPDRQAAVEAVRRASHAWERSFLFVFAVVTAPVVEELLFRGVLWPLVRDSGWPKTGWIGVPLLFAVIHWNAAAVVPLWVLGIFWTWLYDRTGDLTVPMLSHAMFNGTNFMWLILVEARSAV
jgi:membrane protease YdiL (CAAX protease family)